jgi:hypothetical protein
MMHRFEREAIERRPKTMTKGEAEARLKRYETQGKAPGPYMARQIAVAIGKPMMASNGRSYPPLTKAAQKAAERQRRDERHRVSWVVLCIADITKASIAPAEILWRVEGYEREQLLKLAPQAAKWLTELVKALKAQPDYDEPKALPPKHVM